MKDLKFFKEQRLEQTLEGLLEDYDAIFDEKALTPDGTLTNDVRMLASKLAWADVLSAYADEGAPVPKSVQKSSQTWFDKPFRVLKKKAPRYTIQMFVTDYLWDRRGSEVDPEKLGREVVEAYPDSTYAKQPRARATTDINKFNKGLFKCQEVEGKIPEPDQVVTVPRSSKDADSDG